MFDAARMTASMRNAIRDGTSSRKATLAPAAAINEIKCAIVH
jgi:hypothetical protein